MLIFLIMAVGVGAGIYSGIGAGKALAHMQLILKGERKPQYPGHRIHTEPGWMHLRAVAVSAAAMLILLLILHVLRKPDVPDTWEGVAVAVSVLIGLFIGGIYVNVRNKLSPSA